ncbi:DUF2533 family protein [Neobacillus sp. LXY-1]|uniref:DUF2533 family protein n=1 Tax=Neobacillus sp. LXY-1 TaxID=3379133 RepID=UPI003EDF9A71
MSVHKDLIQHAEKQNKQYQEFLALDKQREMLIAEAIDQCKQDKPFSTDQINAVTKQMNSINLRITPIKKYVTVEMVQEYVNSK